MSEIGFVTAVHGKSGLVSEIPEGHLAIFPDYRVLTEDEILKLRRKQEKEMFGEYRTPAPTAKAAEPPAEAPEKEGSK